MDEKPEGWNQDLYEKLSFGFLINCAKRGIFDEWNQVYEAYLKSEWKRLFPDEVFDISNLGNLCASGSGWIQPKFTDINDIISIQEKVTFKDAILIGSVFISAYLSGVDFSYAHMEGATFRYSPLEHAIFNSTYLQGAHFNQTQLTSADFSEAHLEGSYFQYNMLLDTIFSRAHLEGADFSYTHMKDVGFYDSHLDNAKFNYSELDQVDFSNSYMARTNFTKAKLKETVFLEANLYNSNFSMACIDKSDFSNANLKEANYRSAHLEGTEFRGAHLEGAIFNYTIVDGATLFIENTIDDKTNFTGAALSATRIDPSLRTRLERNIREMQWKMWYDKPKFSLWQFLKNIPGKKDETEEEQECNSSLFDRIIINPFVRLFWWVSNYGSSTAKVLGVFVVWNILWACIYQFILPILSGPMLNWTNTTVLHTPDIFTAVLQTNLMMFSITDMATEGLNSIALLCVTVHIVIGYFILAALITRLGIMFQNLSP